jgi:hypothetical protein
MASALVTLTNLDLREVKINLDHAKYCVPSGSCECSSLDMVGMEKLAGTNQMLPRPFKQRICGTRRVGGRSSVSNLPEAITGLPEVQGAKRRGTLLVVRQA